MVLKFDKLFLLVAILLLLNLLSVISLPVKLDLTQNQAFTLSPATKKVVGNLDDIVTVKVFASRYLPPRFLLLRQNLKDLLEEYRWLAKGKIQVDWVVPDNNKATDLAQRFGIPQLQFSSIQEDKFQVSQGYFGLAILFEDQKEIIPVLEDDSNLEYQLTSSILKISQKERPVVGLVEGHGELWENSVKSANTQSLVEKVLGKEFLLENLTLTDNTSIPQNFDALIVAGPKQEYDEKSRFLLDQFIMRDKSVLFFLDGVEVTEDLQVVPAKHNLTSLLEKYGLVLKNNLVLDSSAAVANFNSGISTFFMLYPYWVKILPEGISQENPATFGLQGLVFPWVSSIEFPNQDSRFIPLVYSSPQSWTVDKNFDLNPTQEWQPTEQKPQVLALLFSGKLNSAFAEDQVPTEFQAEFKDKTDRAKLLLVGDSDVISESIAGGFSPNFHFLLNILEFMTSVQNLAQIQVKKQDIRPLKIASHQQVEIIKYGSIIGIPLMIGFIGASYLYWHSKKKFNL